MGQPTNRRQPQEWLDTFTVLQDGEFFGQYASVYAAHLATLIPVPVLQELLSTKRKKIKNFGDFTIKREENE